MVAPNPDLLRKFRNSDNIVKANRSQFIPGLQERYPQDYVDIDTRDKLDFIKPWIEEESKSKIGKTGIERLDNTKCLILQPQIVDKVLILCVDFADRPATLNISKINDRFFSDANTKSFKNYYKEISYSQYVPNGEVHGWYRAPQNSVYYTNNDYGMGSYPNNTRKLVEDVIDIAKNDPNINWASFDTDNDGYLSSIVIVHSGAEAAATGNSNDFWAHVWSMTYTKTVQGKTVSVYALSAEYIYSSLLGGVSGVDCHEFGHLLGLPDLYDYSGNSNGVGDYSLMGSGSWADYGMTPVHLDAWSKYKLGFTGIGNGTKENPTGVVYLTDAETTKNNIKYTTTDPKEFFMTENRQKKLFDSYLPAQGLLIWRINESQTYNNNELCFKVGLLQADGRKDLENKINSGDSGDSFPGSSGNRSFGPSTNPSSTLCNGSKKDMFISNISDSGNMMSFNSSPVTTGSIKFIIYPPITNIYFNGVNPVFKGTTDSINGILIIDNVPVGTINYIVKKTGYYDRTGSAIVLAGETTTVSIILNVIPSTGSLSISSNPSGAQIFIDNINTSFETPNTISQLAPGSYTYTLKLTGYQDKTGSFDILAGQLTTVDAGNLTPLPLTGSLSISSNPFGAKIFIDNVDTSFETPNTISNLSVGSHIYQLKLLGYLDKTGSFDILAGQTTTVDAGQLQLLIAQAGISSLQAILILGLFVGLVYQKSKH